MPDGSQDPSHERFGFSTQMLIDVINAHRGIDGIVPNGCYVPTRYEVATQKPFWLTLILLGWWWESPSELIPSDDQVAAVLTILRSRPDAGHWTIRELIAQAPPPTEGRQSERAHLGEGDE